MNSRSQGRDSFVADCTLGKLVKYLRLAGFDTLYDKQIPDVKRLVMLAGQNRIVLTRTTSVKLSFPSQSHLMIFITDDTVYQQVHQVFTTIGLKAGDLQPLTRCTLCNRVLKVLPKQDALGYVPEYVWQQHPSFRQCPGCQRIYWAGSHAHHALKTIGSWFAEDGQIRRLPS